MHNERDDDLWARFEDRIESDPKGFKAEIFAAARRDNPHLTEANLEAQWEYCASLFDIDA